MTETQAPPPPEHAQSQIEGVPPLKHRRYGWKPELPDARDRYFNARAKFKARRLAPRSPSRVDLRTTGFLPSVVDQYDLGSCTANAIASAYGYEQRRQGLEAYDPSRLFIYYGERDLEGTISYDDGAFIRDGMKVINKLGAPDERLWPYNISQFAVKPPKAAFDDGLKHQAVSYAAVQTVGVQVHVKQALATQTPVVAGFTVYSWFEDIGPSGVATIPTSMGNILGGHAILIVGYETLRSHGGRVYAIIRNSWGSSWGDGGYCYVPLTWLCQLINADDFWAIQEVEA